MLRELILQLVRAAFRRFQILHCFDVAGLRNSLISSLRFNRGFRLLMSQSLRVQLATREGLLVAQPLVLSKQPCMFTTHTLKVKEFGLESLLVRCVCGEFLLELR